MSDEVEPYGDPGAPALAAVAAGLRRDGADLSLYGGFLINALTESLPEELVQVERKRTAGDRMRGRPGEIVAVGVDLGDSRFRLTRAGVGARPQTTVSHVSGGITMKTETVSMDAWAAQLSAALQTAGSQDAAAADAAARLAIPRGSDL